MSKEFVVFISKNLDERYKGNTYYGILTSYLSIMKSKYIESTDPFPIEIGYDRTIIHIAPKEEIEALRPMIPDEIRYIGYVNCNEGVITNCQTYVGIPISIQNCQPGMVNPHIALDSSSNLSKQIGNSIQFKLNSTQRTIAIIGGEKYNVTRWVGEYPAEMDNIELDNYQYQDDLVGYPVFM